MAKEQNTKVMTTESANLGGGDVDEVVSKKKTFHPTVDSSMEDILTSISDGESIAWDVKDLPFFAPSEVEELPYKIAVAYKKAAKERDTIPPELELLGTLSTSASKKLKNRPRKGWHQTWKRPDQFDDALELGYVVIRDPKKDKNGNFLDEKPGEETGDIRKIGPKGDPELIAVEISQARKDAHDRAVSKKSKSAYSSNKDGFRSAVEEVNSSIGSRKDRVVIVDDEE